MLGGCSEAPPRNNIEALMHGAGRQASARLSEHVATHLDNRAALVKSLVGAGFHESSATPGTDCEAWSYSRPVNSLGRHREAFVRLCAQEHVAQVTYSWF